MKAHYLLDTETVKTYLVEQLKLFPADEPLDAEEIGDGNINYVFRVRSRANGKSIIVKQADRLLRSSGRPLDITRGSAPHLRRSYPAVHTSNICLRRYDERYLHGRYFLLR